MQQKLGQVQAWPQTVIAVRNRSTRGWRMLALECELQDLSSRVSEIGLNGVEYRLVDTAHVNPDYAEYCLIRSARRGGWYQNRETGAWFPIEEPLPKLPGPPLDADVSLSLNSINHGLIAIAIEAGGKIIDLSLDDIEDSLVLLVRFIQVLAAGGEPHAGLAEHATARFIVQDDSKSASVPLLC